MTFISLFLNIYLIICNISHTEVIIYIFDIETSNFVQLVNIANVRYHKYYTIQLFSTKGHKVTSFRQALDLRQCWGIDIKLCLWYLRKLISCATKFDAKKFSVKLCKHFLTLNPLNLNNSKNEIKYMNSGSV